MKVTVIKARRGLDLEIRLTLMNRAINGTAGPCFARSLPSLLKDIDERCRLKPEAVNNLQALFIDLFNPRRDRRGYSFAVIQKITGGVFDPTRVAEHSRRMHDGVDVRQTRFQHVLSNCNIRVNTLNFADQTVGVPCGKSGAAQIDRKSVV